MEKILTLMGAALGLLVPYLFVSTVSKGIRDSPFDDNKRI